MKHVESFHGAVTACLVSMGLDSSKVLAACNAWRGSVLADSAETKTEAKLSGKVTTKGDKRRLAIHDRTTEKAKDLRYAAAGALLALSDELRKLTERHGARVTLEALPEEIVDWVSRDTFRPDSAPAPVPVAASVS